MVMLKDDDIAVVEMDKYMATKMIEDDVEGDDDGRVQIYILFKFFSHSSWIFFNLFLKSRRGWRR